MRPVHVSIEKEPHLALSMSSGPVDVPRRSLRRVADPPAPLSTLYQFTNLCQALHNLMPAFSTQGLTLNLPGPVEMTNREFIATIQSLSMRTNYWSAMHYPKIPFKIFATMCEKTFWWPTLDRDMVERMYLDSKTDLELRRAIRAGAGGGMMLGSADSWERCGFKMEELDVLEDVSMRYLRRYRPRSVPLRARGDDQGRRRATDTVSLCGRSRCSTGSLFEFPPTLGQRRTRSRSIVLSARRTLTVHPWSSHIRCPLLPLLLRSHSFPAGILAASVHSIFLCSVDSSSLFTRSPLLCHDSLHDDRVRSRAQPNLVSSTSGRPPSPSELDVRYRPLKIWPTCRGRTTRGHSLPVRLRGIAQLPGQVTLEEDHQR